MGGDRMAQQAVRRTRRSVKRSGRPLWRGLVISVAVTAAAVVLFAVIIGLVDMSDSLIRIINQVIKVGAIFIGVWATVSPGEESAVRRGALIGLIYMGVGVLLYALLTRQQFTWLSYMIDVLMGLAAGGLSGMVLGSLRARQ